MTVYVDNFMAPLGRMLMCHMIADSVDELHAMADRIGVDRRHFQGDHYDVCLAKRKLAIKNGAQAVSSRRIVMVRRELRGDYKKGESHAID